MEDSSKNGIYLPFVHDPVKEKPSVTLLFFYISFCLAAIFVSISSVMLIIDKSYVLAAAYPVVMMYSGFIFYRLRRLDSVKINLEEKSIDFDGEGN
jgi:hypothetical protein